MLLFDFAASANQPKLTSDSDVSTSFLHMQVNIHPFPWRDVQAVYNEHKTLEFPLLKKVSKPSKMADLRTYVKSNSYQEYSEFAEDTDALPNETSEQKHLHEFVKALAGEVVESDLKLEGNICAAIAPARVDKLAKLASGISIDEVRALHDEALEDEEGFASMETDDYIQYLSGLIEFVKAAAGKDVCLLVHVG